MIEERRAELYYTLAEALADLPAWFVLPGHEWPLTKAAARFASDSETAKMAVEALAYIPAESEAVRRRRYTHLFGGPGRPRFWLYESMWRTGRFLGPEMIALEQLYAGAGLQVVGAETADHVSVELAFLAHLAERQAAQPDYAPKWKQLERLFIKKHAGQWLPTLGRSLGTSGDEVYGPIGELMAGWILETQRPQRRQRKPDRNNHWPGISREELCSLCGFCVQVCQTRALKIHETSHDTTLWLYASACNGCQRCERVCPTGVLQLRYLEDEHPRPDLSAVLRRSPRVYCPGCGEATVSQAEIDFITGQIGYPDWLLYCLPCRSELIEKKR